MIAEKLFNVSGKAAIVTGGARGIGLAIARALAENGAYVTILDREIDALSSAAGDLAGGEPRIFLDNVDVTDAAQLQLALARIVERHGAIDVVFANAGVAGGPGFLTADRKRSTAGAIDGIPMTEWKQTVDVNLHGVFNTVRAALPVMKRQRKGSIVVTGSVAGTKTSPMVATPYPATKAAVAHLVRHLARELAPFNIRVNTIQPGPIQTDFVSAEVRETFAAAAPGARLGRPEDIEGLALFFASAASSFVTGAQYPVDGGQLLGPAD